MKGVYSKQAIRSVVEPLKAISSVFSNTAVHVVYENEEGAMYISAVNQKKSVYAMYELKAEEVIDGYGVGVEEIGIWDVKQFISILGKYDNDIYSEDVTIECDAKQLTISCGNETANYYHAQLHLFDESRTKTRRLKTESLTEAAAFELDGVELKKLLVNINVFDDQDIITLVGEEDANGVKVRLSSSANSVPNKNETKLENVEVKADFSLSFIKSDFKGLLSCNDKFKFHIYTGKKQIVNASYSREFYSMNFYFVPIDEK